MWYKKLDSQTLGICGILIYVMLDALTKFFFPIELFRYFFLGIMVAFAIIFKLRSIITFQDVCLLCAIPFLFFNNAALEHGLYSSIITYALMLALFIFAKNGEQWFFSVLKIIGGFAVFYGLATFILGAMPSFYEQNIIPLFSEADQISLRNNFVLGYLAGLTTHYSHNAMFMSLGTGLFASLLICGYFNGNKKILTIIGLIICVLALLLTGKRGHIIFSAVSVIVAFFFYHSDKKNSRLLKLLLIAGVVIAFVYILSNFIPGLLNIFKRFAEMEEAGSLTSGRDKLVEIAYELFLTSPVWGVGWFRFRYVHIQRMPWFTNMVHVHNVYMQLLCEVGIIGFIIYMAFFFSSYLQSIRLMIAERKKRCNIPQKYSVILLYSVFLQTFFLTYAITGNPLYDTIIFYPYILVIMMTIIINKNYGPLYLRKKKTILKIS